MEASINFPLIILLLALGFLSRAYSLLRHKWVGKDIFYNLWVAREIRTTKKLPKQQERYPYPEVYLHPPLPHIFMALFPEKYHHRLQIIFPLLDVINGILIYMVCLRIVNPSVALMALALYLFLPMSRDNYFSLSVRGLGNSFLCLSLLALLAFFVTSSLFYFAVAAFTASLVFLTHRLTLQSLAAVLAALSLFLWTIIPLLVLFLGFILAMLLSRGYYLKVLKGHVSFLFNMALSLRDKKIRSTQAGVFPNPMLFFFNVPVLILIPLLVSIKGDLKTDFFLIWALSLLVLAVIWVLGEGYRHMANATMPFSVLTAVWAHNSSNQLIFLFFLVVCIIFTLVKIIRIEKDKTTILSDDMLSAFQWLKRNCTPNDVVLCLPVDLSHALVYFTGCKVLSGGGWKGMIYDRSVLAVKAREGKLADPIKQFNVKYILAMGTWNIPDKPVFSSGDVQIMETSL